MQARFSSSVNGMNIRIVLPALVLVLVLSCALPLPRLPCMKVVAFFRLDRVRTHETPSAGVDVGASGCLSASDQMMSLNFETIHA
jgi:hypothetical protein